MWGEHIQSHTERVFFSLAKYPRAQIGWANAWSLSIHHIIYIRAVSGQLMISFLCIIALHLQSMSSTYLFTCLQVASASRHLSLQYGEGSCICILCASGTTFCLLFTTHLQIPPRNGCVLLIYPADLQTPYPPKSIRSTLGFPKRRQPTLAPLH
jgi:hypothetical protein